MKIKCIVIEDQPPAQRILKKYIEDFGEIELLGVYGDAMSAREVLSEGQVDLMFLDIHLPKISGIEFLKTLTHPPYVILTTAFTEFALEGYELNVVDYLLKPFSFSRFITAVDKVHERLPKSSHKEETHYIYIKVGFDHVKINLDDVLYIKSDGDYTEVYCSDQRYISSNTLKHWLSTYPDQFLQVHKSYLVSEAHILKVKTSSIELSHDVTIPIGRKYKGLLTDLTSN